MGNGLGIPIKHIGHSFPNSTDFNTIFTLPNLMHVPNIAENLISVSKFARDNHVFF